MIKVNNNDNNDNDDHVNYNINEHWIINDNEECDANNESPMTRMPMLQPASSL